LGPENTASTRTTQHTAASTESRNISRKARQECQVRGIAFLLLWTTATAAIRLGAVAAGLIGWLIIKTTIIERTVLIAYPSLIQDVIDIGLFGLAGLLHYRRRRGAAI
jgi:hypothetical protein